MCPAKNDDQMLRTLLGAVGAHLEARGETASIVIVGGAALCLRGWVARTTRDVDVIATTSADKLRWSPPELSETLVAIAAKVALDHGVDDDWLNAVIGVQWATGLPEGIEEGIEWMTFGALGVGLVGRGPDSVHFQDLVVPAPTDEELESARAWILPQDTSASFPASVEEVVARVRRSC